MTTVYFGPLFTRQFDIRISDADVGKYRWLAATSIKAFLLPLAYITRGTGGPGSQHIETKRTKF
jgi:hypothetical protein